MSDTRRTQILIVTKRLVIFVTISLLIAAVIFSPAFLCPGFFCENEKRLMISWLVFECGLIGGFVSIQQRLGRIDTSELELLSKSRTAILLIPVYGGIFALLLYVLFLSGIIGGDLFPTFYIPEFSTPPTPANIIALLKETNPEQGPDLAKLIFWSFVAGFSERFMPQIIQNIVSKGIDERDGSNPPKPPA